MIPTVYGFADAGQVEQLITVRLNNIDAGDAPTLADTLGQAVFALLEINNSIPVHSKSRHLVATALENFAEGR